MTTDIVVAVFCTVGVIVAADNRYYGAATLLGVGALAIIGGLIW